MFSSKVLNSMVIMQQGEKNKREILCCFSRCFGIFLCRVLICE